MTADKKAIGLSIVHTPTILGITCPYKIFV